MKLHCFARGAAAAALFGVAAASQALIAFDNFGPEDTFQTGVGYTVSGSQAVNVMPICQFTSLETGMLDKITVPIGYVSGANGIQLRFYNDSGDVLGAWLVAWQTANPFPAFGTAYAPFTFTNAFNDPNSFPDLVLHAGSKYWVGLEPMDVDSWLAWNWNSVGDKGLIAYSTDGGAVWDYHANQTRAAMRVEVTPTSVPGPAALLPFAFGLIAAWRRRR